jgi:Flp pilus assembly protein TadG
MKTTGTTKFIEAGKRVMARLGVRRFAAEQKGAAAIEFGLVAAPFLALLFAIMETAFVFFAGQSLEYAASQSGRLIKTGQADSGGWDQAGFKTQVCAMMVALFDCQNKLYVNVQTYTSFSSASTSAPYNGTGQLDTSKMNYQPGTAGSIVVVQLYYQWPIYVSLFHNNLQNQTGNNRLLIATSAFRNEPFK